MHGWRPQTIASVAPRRVSQRSALQSRSIVAVMAVVGTFRLRSGRRWRRPMAGTSSIKGFAAFWWASG